MDSSEIAFKIAGSMALQDAVKNGSPVLLEPVMSVEVIVPEDYLGDVLGDLNSRRAQITGIHQRHDAHAVDAIVPLKEMFGYATDLRSTHAGTGGLHDAVLALFGSGDQRNPENV